MNKMMAVRVWWVLFSLWLVCGGILAAFYGVVPMLAWFVSALVFPTYKQVTLNPPAPEYEMGASKEE